jgi:hypothetical protein
MRGILGLPDAPSVEGTNSDGTGFLHACRFIAEGNGKPGNVHVWVNAVLGAGTRSQKQRFVIYDGDGGPFSLKAVTDEITVDQTTPVGQWVTFAATYANFGTPASLVAGVPYWMGWWAGPQVNSGTLQYGWRNCGLPNASNPSGLGEAFNTTDTYSATGNPPNVPATFGSPGRQYLMYFDIGDGAAMPGDVLGLPGGLYINGGAGNQYRQYEEQDEIAPYAVTRF